jgi:hypothetical protein
LPDEIYVLDASLDLSSIRTFVELTARELQADQASIDDMVQAVYEQRGDYGFAQRGFDNEMYGFFVFGYSLGLTLRGFTQYLFKLSFRLPDRC